MRISPVISHICPGDAIGTFPLSVRIVSVEPAELTSLLETTVSNVLGNGQRDGEKDDGRRSQYKLLIEVKAPSNHDAKKYKVGKGLNTTGRLQQVSDRLKWRLECYKSQACVIETSRRLLHQSESKETGPHDTSQQLGAANLRSK
jgi:hypothetical protein